MINLKHPLDYKWEHEELEDAGEECDWANTISQAQQDAIEATLVEVRKNMVKLFKSGNMNEKTILKALDN